MLVTQARYVAPDISGVSKSRVKYIPGSRIEGDEAVPASSNFAASYYESYITCAPQSLTSSPWKPI